MDKKQIARIVDTIDPSEAPVGARTMCFDGRSPSRADVFGRRPRVDTFNVQHFALRRRIVWMWLDRLAGISPTVPDVHIFGHRFGTPLRPRTAELPGIET